jgi:hypothetical protein
MKFRTKLGTNLLLLAIVSLQLFPISPTQAWFGNGQCKKAIASANKATSDDAVLSRIIVNNRKCFDPTVVANAQLCMKWDWNTKKSGWIFNQIACTNLPSKFK